jgi:hypothetical protein
MKSFLGKKWTLTILSHFNSVGYKASLGTPNPEPNRH